MKARHLYVPLSLALLAVVTTGGAQVYAGEGAARRVPSSDDASERFRSGVAFYKDGDFTAAQVEFKRAYELSPNYRVLYNLGQTSRELKDYAAALAAFKQYLREGGKEIPAARRKDVQSWVGQLEQKVGTITVSANVSGAEILLDDARLGVSPLSAPVVVNVGRHKFSASLGGYRAAQRVLDVAGMQDVTVALELTRLDELAHASTKPEPRRAPEAAPVAERKRSVAPWVVLSVTAASGIATGVFGGLALSAKSDLRDALAAYPGRSAPITAAQDRTRVFAITADIAGAVTVAGAVATTVLFVIAPASTEKARPRAAVHVAPNGLFVRGLF